MEKYVKINLVGGNGYVQPLSEIHQAVDAEFHDADTGTRLILTLIDMTEEEYEKLPEFMGH